MELGGEKTIKEDEREKEKGYDGRTTRENGDEDKVQDEVMIMENSSLSRTNPALKFFNCFAWTVGVVTDL